MSPAGEFVAVAAAESLAGGQGCDKAGRAGVGRGLICREGKRQVLSHENQTEGALNIDAIVTTGNGAIFDRANEISQEPTSFWHFPLPKTLCRVITVPTARAWTLELLSVPCRCQLNRQIIAF